VVERLADWCAIDLLDDAGQIRRLTVAHRDPLKAALGADLPDRLPPDSVETYGAPNVLRTGRSELHAEIAGERSLMCVPLIARGRVLGAITFASDGRRRFTPEDLGEAEELARRAAIAVDNARLFHEAERRADAARVLAYIGDGVFLLDADGIVRLWNRAAETITGLTASQVVGRRVAEALPGWAAIADRVPIAAAPGAGTAAETLPLELPTQELWLSISGVGFLEGTVFAFRDLTEERAIERLKSDFVSTVSHELRTPLAAIYGAALRPHAGRAPAREPPRRRRERGRQVGTHRQRHPLDEPARHRHAARRDREL
jgi:signal transduction histidine kinase